MGKLRIGQPDLALRHVLPDVTSGTTTAFSVFLLNPVSILLTHPNQQRDSPQCQLSPCPSSLPLWCVADGPEC